MIINENLADRKVGGNYTIKSIANEDGTQTFEITTVQEGGIRPTGILKIRQNGIYNIAEYEQVEVEISNG